MKHFVPFYCYQFLCATLLPCVAVATVADAPKNNYAKIEWTDLIPEDDLEALLNPPSYIADIPEGGGMEEQIAADMATAIASANDDRYMQALESTNIVEAYDQKQISIAGFVAPLEFDDDMKITEFFLAPYFGACIHLPPPPPNQLIYVTAAEGMAVDQIYEPFVISGTLSAKLVDNEFAVAAYSIEMDSFEVYSESE